MAYAESRTFTLKVDASPSFFFNNLAASPDARAWAHHGEVAVVRPAAWEARSDADGAADERLVASRGGAAVTSLAWVAEPGRGGAGAALLAATTREEFVLFARGGGAPALSVALKALPAALLGGRAPASHFFRGVAGARAAGLVLVGTSWGDILTWRVGAAVGGGAQVADVMKGAHAAAIVAIAADDE